MLRYLHSHDLARYPDLSRTMFRDRGRQFHGRLRWEVTVDDDGCERDEYDDLDPLYVIWQLPDGTHGGSMRFLPTTGRTMVNDHFRDLSDGKEIVSGRIWECTRFCLSPDADPKASAALMLGAFETGRGAGLSHIVGVFDARMIRIYRRLGWGPIVLGTSGVGRHAISSGLWACDEAFRPRLLSGAGVSAEVSQAWYDRSRIDYRAAA